MISPKLNSYKSTSMPKVLILQGLPASGKSTFAKKLVLEDRRWKRINKDDLRLMIHDGKWTSKKERDIIQVRNILLKQFLGEGKNVIIDDTNFHPSHIRDITLQAQAMNAEVEVKLFSVPLDVAIKRDLLRPNSVGKDVIVEMYNKYVLPTVFPKVTQDRTLKNAVIFDVDGTLATMSGRSPFDVEKVVTDDLNGNIHELVEIFRNAGKEIIICSGRKIAASAGTVMWLEKHSIEYSELYMRENDDNRGDDIVKREMLERIIKKYHVDFVVDDRPRVVRMWKASGLSVLNVGGEIEF